MATLYVTEQGATLRKEQNRIIVECDERAIAEIHDFKIERVVVFGNVQLTSQVMAHLLHNGIDTSFVTLSGRLKGRLAAIESKNVALRLKQYERTQDARYSRQMAAAIVSGKIGNGIEILSRYQRNHPENDFNADIGQLRAVLHKIAAVPTLESLRGLEGQAANLYFKGFARMLRRDMQFTRRSRRPATDPVNALLNFAYALLYNEAISALVTAGFDVYLGFYHAPHYGRCSLALDLMEEMRPVIADRLALSLINREVIKASDFTAENGGVWLTMEARKAFLKEYERLMNAAFQDRKTGVSVSFRRTLYNQALAMQKAVLDGTLYQPFSGWH